MINKLLDFHTFETFPLDENLHSVFGYTSPQERKLNAWYAEEKYSGKGEIVDLGCFVGASTLALASGLKKNPNVRNKKIHAYDAFINFWGDSYLKDIPVGGNFSEVFEVNTRAFKEYIQVHRVSTDKINWSGDPIEYLLVDIMKDWDIAKRVTSEFFPHLIPKKSFVIHQDFAHWWEAWIHLIMYRLRDYLKPIPNESFTTTVIFFSDKSISKELCEQVCDLTQIQIHEIDAAFNYSHSIVPKNSQPAIFSAKAMFYFHLAHLPEQSSLDRERFIDLAVYEFFKIPPRFRNESNTQETLRILRPFVARNKKKYRSKIITKNIGIALDYVRRLFLSLILLKTSEIKTIPQRAAKSLRYFFDHIKEL